MKTINLKLVITTVVLILIYMPIGASNNWGQTGHRVVGEICEEYLKPRTKRKIAKLLKKKSLAFVSTFADEIKSDSLYDRFYTWHYINMPFSTNYESSEKNPSGDLVSGIDYCKKIIADKNASDEDKIFYLKMLVHLIGDLHQPMHIGLVEDRGGNDFKVQWHYNDTNLHRVWDSEMINEFDMGYLELARNKDALGKDQIQQIQEGTVVDWVNETQQITKKIYAEVKPGDNLRYRYSYQNFTIVRDQLQIAGIRLAKVLNDLF